MTDFDNNQLQGQPTPEQQPEPQPQPAPPGAAYGAGSSRCPRGSRGNPL